MEHSSSWEGNSHSASQDIPRLLPCSQQPATGLCPEPYESSQRFPILFP
jgi:hypothetical protein